MARADISGAREALAALARGDRPTRAQSAALRRADRIVGARRPLASYAPRTQRRYLAAAEAGVSAHDINAREYQRTRARARGKSRRDQIRDQAAANLGTGVENLGQFDEDQIDELIHLVGERGALSLLRGQAQAIRAYRRGDISVGNARWYDRPDIVERFRSGVGFDEYTVPYFFYHARK